MTVPIRIPFAMPFLGPEEERAVLEVVRSGWLVQGPKVAEFEHSVASYVGVRHAIATTSCTTALHLALLLHGIGPGDEVIVPSLSFIATANAVVYVGATPVLVDVDPLTYNIDPGAIETAITPKTRAIVPVHQLGLAADIARIQGIAQRHGLLIVEDAAPALGATFHGRRVGGYGNTTCFSFHPRKAVTTGEGGVVVTDDDTLAERARTLRAHGMSASALDRHRANRVVIETYGDIGYNFRMTDLHAAVGIEQMKKLGFVLERRRQVATRFTDALSCVDGLQLPCSTPGTPHTYQSYMVELHKPLTRSRDEVMQELLEVGIATRRGVMAIHLEAPYRERNPCLRLPVTERASRNTLILPLYASMTDAEQGFVIENLCRILRTARV